MPSESNRDCDFRPPCPQPVGPTVYPCCHYIAEVVNTFNASVQAGLTAVIAGLAGITDGSAPSRLQQYIAAVSTLSQNFLGALKRFNCDKCEKNDKLCCEEITSALLEIAQSALAQLAALVLDASIPNDTSPLGLASLIQNILTTAQNNFGGLLDALCCTRQCYPFQEERCRPCEKPWYSQYKVEGEKRKKRHHKKEESSSSSSSSHSKKW